MICFELGYQVLARCVDVIQIFTTFSMAILGTSEYSRKCLVRTIQTGFINNNYIPLRTSNPPDDIRLLLGQSKLFDKNPKSFLFLDIVHSNFVKGAHYILGQISR